MSKNPKVRVLSLVLALSFAAASLAACGDSGFASPDLYRACEDHDCKYAIRLKENRKLRELASDAEQALYRATKENTVDYAVSDIND